MKHVEMSRESEPGVARFASDADRPYPPGWFDRLTDRLDRMPGPNFLYCLALLFLQLGYVTALLWWNGKVPFGSFDLRLVFPVVVAPYLLWVRFYLDRVAGEALDAFRPVLTVGDGEFLNLRYELTTLPARTTRIVTAVAMTVFLLNTSFLLPSSIVTQFGSSLGAALIVIGPIGLFTVAVVAISAAQAVHQLRMVERIYDLVGKIALLRAKPLHAFSQLTARTGVSFLLLTYYVAAARPDLVSKSPGLEALLVAMVPTAVACFVLPLRGMHRRLVAEKDRALAQVASRFETVFARLHRADRSGDPDRRRQVQPADHQSQRRARRAGARFHLAVGTRHPDGVSRHSPAGVDLGNPTCVREGGI